MRGASVRWQAFESNPRLRRVREELEQNISKPFSLTAAASLLDLHPKYFSAFFVRRCGLRFTDWVHYVRTERAKQLLRTTGLYIVDVARVVGYRDLRTFERAFKKHNGLTAYRYRRSHRARSDVFAKPADAPAVAAGPRDLL